MDATNNPSAVGTPRTTLGVKLFLALVILGFLAAGYGGIKTYLDKSAQATGLEEDGVEADADVSSVSEVSGRRIETYHKLFVFYDEEDSIGPVFAHVTDCSGHRYERGIETVRIVYLPKDPEVVALEACRSNFDANVFPGIVGVAFAALGLLVAWRARGVWTQ